MKWCLTIVICFLSFISNAQSLEDLVLEAGNLYIKGEYAKAIPAAQKAAVAVRESMGEENIFYTGLLTIEASSYKFTFQYELAEKTYIDLKERIRKISGESDESYTSCLNNFAGLYEKIGQYQKAESLYLEAMEIRKRLVGENDDSYSTCLNGLAALYHTMGLYAKAEPLYSKVIQIRKHLFGEENVLYATSLNNLATLYTETGQYEKAESLYLSANAIHKKIAGEEDLNFALGLNNIGSLWQQTKQFKKAEDAYLRAAAIRKKLLGTDNPDYATSLNNLATLYADQKLYKKAESLLTEAVAIWKKTEGEYSSAYATGINNLGGLYRKTGEDFTRAESYYLQALALRKKILGVMHPYYAETENDLALLYTQAKLYAKAEPLFLSSSAILLKNISSTFTILSEKEKANFLEYNKSFIDCNNSFLYLNPAASTAIRENNFNLELNFKSYSLTDTKKMLAIARNSADTGLKKVFDQWINLKSFLAKQYSLPVSDRAINIKAKETEAEDLEKTINRISSLFYREQQALNIKLKDVQQHLEENEAAIEFVKFRVYNKNNTDSVIYAAYILTKQGDAPAFVRLCEEQQLQKIFDSAGSTPNRLVKNLYRGSGNSTGESKLGIKLYKLIWAPLEPYLAGIKKISYSPAGSLYGVAFHALTIDTARILIDKYQLQQYTSTREVALRKLVNDSTAPKNIFLFGDPLFSMDSLQLVNHRKKLESTPGSTGSDVATRGSGMGIWSRLPGTAEEINTIKELFDRNKIVAVVFAGDEATEDNLKHLSDKSADVLHIATHGFFMPKVDPSVTAEGNVYSLSKDPLMRSGLVLAGGNYVWMGKTPISGIDDGIATAYEISQINLSNTSLLVLSACESALGDVKGNEGVFGLQRGFKMAGVKKMIVSLWQVPDKETAELMTTFYSYWMKGNGINESFYNAQSDLRKKYSAYYWAAFVLLE